MKKEWIRKAFEDAKEHGFHDKEYSDEHFLVLVACEVAEAIEADRKGSIPEINQFKINLGYQGNNGEAFKTLYRKYIKGSVAEEMADVCIRLFALAGLRGIDICEDELEHIRKKVKWLFRDLWDISTFTEIAYDLIHFMTSNDYITKDKIIVGIALTEAWAKMQGIDLDFHIEMKMRYNRTRALRHGKRYG